MQISAANQPKPIRVRDPPLHRSTSVTAIIHGSKDNNSNHYIDSLQRFERNFAAVDQNQRSNQRQKKQQIYERRRNESMERLYNIKQRQQQNLDKLANRQYRSQMLHDMGAMKSLHTESIAVNPISLNYQNNYRGKYQQHLDQQNKVNQLVRAHNLRIHGTSGFNIITGKSSMPLQNLIPPQAQESFQKKLQVFYSKYRINPFKQS